MSKTVTLCLSLFSILIIATTSSAQITINQSDIQNLIGNSYNVDSYTTTTGSDLTTVAAISGANKTFDFTNITSFTKDYSGQVSYLNVSASIPGANDPDFSNANAVIRINFTGSGQYADSASWAYVQLTSAGAYSAGSIFVSQQDLNGDGTTPDTVKTANNPYLLNLKLPLTYGTNWKDTTSSTISDGSLSVTQSRIIDATVDGWGTLKIPNETVDCLRLKITTTTSTTIGGIQVTSTSGAIEFITMSGASVGASIDLDSNGNPVSATYTEIASATPIEKAPQTLVKDYRLDQNYPNPFNPSTVISYSLKKAGSVKLDIYNSLGQHVASLVDGMKSAGSHKVTFNAAGLNSGLYFYKIQTNGFSQTKKMMLIK